MAILRWGDGGALLLPPALEGLPHLGLGIDPEGVGDAIDVVEIGDHLDRVQDVAVAQPVLAQGVEVLAPDGGGRAGQKLGEFAERLLARRKFRPPVIVLDVFGQLRVGGFRTEILPVGFDSIKAVVGPGDHRAKHLALGAGET